MADKTKPVDVSKLRSTLTENCQIENALAAALAGPIDGDDVPLQQDCKNITIPKDMTPEKAEAHNKALRQNLKGWSDALRVSKA
jgi:hypothetical protein